MTYIFFLSTYLHLFEATAAIPLISPLPGLCTIALTTVKLAVFSLSAMNSFLVMDLKNVPIPGEAFFGVVETSSFSQLSSIRFLGGGDLLEPRPFVTTSSFFLFLSAVVCLTEAFVEFVLTCLGFFDFFDEPVVVLLGDESLTVSPFVVIGVSTCFALGFLFLDGTEGVTFGDEFSTVLSFLIDVSAPFDFDFRFFDGPVLVIFGGEF